MFARKFSLAIIATALMAGTSFAQQTDWVEVDDDVMIDAFEADADTVDDWDVYDGEGTEIGEVEEVVGPDAQTATALIVDFEGNGGYADQDVIVPLENFELDGQQLVLTLGPDEVAELEIDRD